MHTYTHPGGSWVPFDFSLPAWIHEGICVLHTYTHAYIYTYIHPPGGSRGHFDFFWPAWAWFGSLCKISHVNKCLMNKCHHYVSKSLLLQITTFPNHYFYKSLLVLYHIVTRPSPLTFICVTFLLILSRRALAFWGRRVWPGRAWCTRSPGFTFGFFVALCHDTTL